MRIASPASKSPSKPVQALTGTLFGVKLWQSLSAVSVARHCFFRATPHQKLHPYVTQILSSFLRIVKCIFAKSPAPCSCHHARIFPACTLQTDPAGSFYYRVAGSVLSRIFQHLQFRKFSVHQDPLPLPYAFPAFTCTPSGSDRFLRDPVHADLSL